MNNDYAKTWDTSDALLTTAAAPTGPVTLTSD
jgi:hypothetical protein